ncbi:unnamed protein product [Chondrus crispus]|uniref:ER membrane protein complex subunit 4 n=1 Tax=Chondrus crispus TaxID=2769 RepID=R7QN79_CHOCR|nr:unnamed protein product [Chondrus crispus]CDF39957.1 unnamed protein product [Chondrus crispus]|eukprot:XP_005710251.1 unnamed protein product [Chondrus crispus]
MCKSSSACDTKHRWSLNYTDESTNVAAPTQPSRASAVRAAIGKYETPPGFPSEVSARNLFMLRKVTASSKASGSNGKESPSKPDLNAAYSASWSIAFSPARSLVTSAFALFMSSTSVQFFSVATTITVLFMHIQAIFATGEAFKQVAKSGIPTKMLAPQVLVHLLLISAGVAVGLYKAHLLGFLPTTQSDWVSLLPLRIIEDGYLRLAVTM